VDLAPWMGQLGLGAAAVVLFLTVGKSYINYISRQLSDERAAHERELDRRDKEIARLTDLWNQRLAAEVKRGDAWETAANSHREANRESTEQLRKLTAVTETTVALLTAIREQGRS
jgi:hypothetical protein